MGLLAEKKGGPESEYLVSAGTLKVYFKEVTLESSKKIVP